MPLPEEHLRVLRESTEFHERRLAQLRENIRVAEEEIAAHEVLLELARNDRIIALLGEFYDNWDVALEFARDPLQYCQEADIQLPQGMTIGAVEIEESSTRLTAYLVYELGTLEVLWDREGVFNARLRGGRLGSRPQSLNLSMPS